MFHGHLNYFQKPPLGGMPNIKPGDHGTPNAHNHWFFLFYHVWGLAWIRFYWNSIWLRAQSHMTSLNTCGFVTTLYDFGGALRQPLHTFFWALTISWSQLLGRVCEVALRKDTKTQSLVDRQLRLHWDPLRYMGIICLLFSNIVNRYQYNVLLLQYIYIQTRAHPP